MSGLGPEAVDLAARIGDGYWGVAPDRDLLERYAATGGRGRRIAQLNPCWAHTAETARKTVVDVWPNTGVTGQLAQDLATWTHFEQATAVLTEDQISASIPCGPALEPVLDSVHAYREAGYDHVYFHQIGADQDGLLALLARGAAPRAAALTRWRRTRARGREPRHARLGARSRGNRDRRWPIGAGSPQFDVRASRSCREHERGPRRPRVRRM